MILQVVYFGRCWSRWIRRHGGAVAVDSYTYLSAAEAFVSDFLASVAGDGSESRPQGAFQGVLLAVDASERLVKQVRHVASTWVSPRSGMLYVGAPACFSLYMLVSNSLGTRRSDLKIAVLLVVAAAVVAKAHALTAPPTAQQ